MTNSLRVLLFVLAWFNQGYSFYKTTQGRPVRWYQQEIPVEVDALGTDDVAGDGEFGAIALSMNTWNQVAECAHPKFINKGAVSGLKPSPDSSHNLIIFETREQWMDNHHDPMDHVIAWTTLYFDDDADDGNGPNGKAHKFDMELADFAFTFSISDEPGITETDIQNTVTHELGHVLGLDHSKVPDATMYSTAPAADISKRDLAADDVEGLCTLYAPIFAADNSEVADSCCSWFVPEGNGTGGDGCIATGRGVASPFLLLFLALAFMKGHRTWNV